MINDHKAPEQLRVCSGNEVIDFETELGEFKIQISMIINFVFSKDSYDIRTMRTKSDFIYIYIYIS